MNIRYTAAAAAAVLLMILSSCGGGKEAGWASGIFEAEEVLVSAEGSGRILRLEAEEGRTIHSGEVLGEIDSVQLTLKLGQLEASRQALEERKADLQVQTAPLRQQLESMATEETRVENLLKASAVNQKALDDLLAQKALLEKQLEAQILTIRSGNAALESEGRALDFQIRQLRDQIDRCRIVSPLEGTVLVRYAREGELAQPGKVLFKAGDLETLIFRAYLTADQLNGLGPGTAVTVLADFGTAGEVSFPGTVAWISPESEFTPKTIQTSDERAQLVYAVKAAVPNREGRLRIGMYGRMLLEEK